MTISLAVLWQVEEAPKIGMIIDDFEEIFADLSTIHQSWRVEIVEDWNQNVWRSWNHLEGAVRNLMSRSLERW